MNQEETTKVKHHVEGTRYVYTFSVLSNASFCSLELAKESEEGQLHNCMFSMLSSAFALEAYLNHLGQDKFGEKEWEKIERGMSVESKLRVLAKLINYDLDFGKRPCQTFRKIMWYRNTMVHAGTEILPYEEVQVYDPVEGPAEPETKWEQATTLETAERFYEDTRAMIDQLNEANRMYEARRLGEEQGLPMSEALKWVKLLSWWPSGGSEYCARPVSENE